MNRRQFLRGIAVAAGSPALIDRRPRAVHELHQAAARSQVSREQQWIAVAERLKPTLHRQSTAPVSLVRPVAAPEAFLRWRMEPVGAAASLSERLLKPGDSVTLDFGTHLTGYVNLSLAGEGRGIDAPARLKLTFGEVPGEV